MSKGANLAPQEISMLFRVLPETNCQGLFNQIHKKFKNIHAFYRCHFLQLIFLCCLDIIEVGKSLLFIF